MKEKELDSWEALEDEGKALRDLLADRRICVQSILRALTERLG